MAILKIERGETKLSLDRLQKIADLLAVSVMDLLPSDGHVIHNSNCAISFQGYHQYVSNDQEEITRLLMVIEHQKQMLAQKDKELAMKDELIMLYRTNAQS